MDLIQGIRNLFTVKAPFETLAHINEANARRALVIAPLVALVDSFVFVMRALGLSKNTSPWPVVDNVVYLLTLALSVIFFFQARRFLKKREHQIFTYGTYLFCFIILLHGSYFQVVDSGIVPFYLPMAAVYIVFYLKPLPSLLIMATTGFLFTLYRLVTGNLIITYAIVIFIICVISVYGSAAFPPR